MLFSTLHLQLLLFSFLLLNTIFPVGVTRAIEIEKRRFLVGYTDESDLALIRDAGGEGFKDFSQIRVVGCYLPLTSVDALKAHPRIRYVEPGDLIVRGCSEVLDWGVYRVRAPCGWDNNGDLIVDPGTKASTGEGVCVAVLDTGIDTDHPDLVDKVINGISFVSGTTGYDDDNGHGTHVAGIIAALDNDIGVVGVAPNASLWAIKVLDCNLNGNVEDLVEGVLYVVDYGLNIACMALGLPGNSSALYEACQYAYNHGVLLIAAAGYTSTIAYPARYPTVVAVGDVDEACNRPEGMPVGPELEFVAPGVNINSTVLNGMYALKSGTSMACAQVAGMAALVFASPIDHNYSSDDHWDNYEVREKLRQMALDLGSSGKDEEYGYGLVNGWATNQRPLGDINIDWKVEIGDLAFVIGYYGTWWDPPNPQNYSWAIADITIDNRVDIIDVAIVSGNYGKHYP